MHWIKTFFCKKQIFIDSVPYDGKIFVHEKDGSKRQQILAEFFKKELEVTFLPTLAFENDGTRKNIEKKCKSALQEKETDASLFWGTYYGSEFIKIPPVYIKWIDPVMEWGLFAKEKIKKNTCIGEYTGLVVPYRKNIHDFNAYCFEYSIAGQKTRYTIDALLQGNWTRLINHKKEANLVQRGVFFENLWRVIFLTSRDILQDEELTYDYGDSYWKKREKPLEL